MKYLSENSKKLSGQPMFHILARANELEKQGRNILHFELGDPDFNTPGNIVNAVNDSLIRGETHYTNSKGLFEFRIAAADATERSRKFRPLMEQILVCPGANSIIFYAIGCTINPGDEVIIPDPCFPTYVSAINFFGGKAVKVPLKEENEFRLNPDDLEKAITNKTRLIIINSPQNPTGSVLKEEEIKKIYDIAEKHDVYLLSDEIYSRMLYQDAETKFCSPSKYDECKKRVIVANGFSKSYAMTGWRLGVAIGPVELIEKMGLLVETNVSCVSPFIQKAGVEALKGDQKQIENMMQEFRERREIIVNGLNSLPGIKCLKPKGAFYAFPNISRTGMKDKEFCDMMLEHAGVACVPGSVFGEDYTDYVRFCYASSKEDILKAIERMEKVLQGKVNECVKNIVNTNDKVKNSVILEKNTMKLSDYVLDFLKKQGVNHAFLITGGAIMNIVDSFDENKNIKYICTTQEQGAAIAAEAYSRINKNLGVAMATSGPGATNLITGIGCAYFDSIPTLYITGQVNTYESTWESGPRQVGFQETDIVSMIKPITKMAVKVDNPEDIRYYLEKAIYIAKTGRPGPVLLDIPMNVQRAPIEPEKLRSYIPEKSEIDYNLLNRKIEQTIELINQSRRPVIILGAGVKLGKAEDKARKFVEKLGIPVALTWGAMDVLPHNHPLFIEGFGVSANRAGNFAVQNSDLIITFGSRLDTRQTGGKPETFARSAKKVIIDVDKDELYKGRGVKIDIDINFDVNDFLNEINKKIDNIRVNDLSEWKIKIKEWKQRYPICLPEYYAQRDKINPYVFMDVLSDECKENDIVITDAGGNLTWTMQGFKVKEGQKLFSAFGNSPMGYSLPAAMGASVAANNKPVICIIGDGGIKMNINELETIVRYKLPVKIFVINNHEYGIIKQFQDVWLNSSYKATCIEGGLGDPDFLKIANSYDMEAIQINNHSELRDKIKKVLDFPGPILCSVELNCGEKIKPKLEFGKPIEDPAPLIDREEFKKNMLVPPLDESIKAPQLSGH